MGGINARKLGRDYMINVQENLRPKKVLALDAVLFALFVVGMLLLLINIYGLFQTVRKPGLGVVDHEKLRFIPEEVWSYKTSMEAIDQLYELRSIRDIAKKANRVVNESLVHIDWMEVDPKEYRQLVPIWENYFLWAIGTFSGLPQFERYHYANYKRNIRRGIGICGDASTVLSSILDNHKIENRIVSFKGHVVVEFEDDKGNWLLVDPDFGVEMHGSLEQLTQNPEDFRRYYIEAGYPSTEVDYLFEAYNTKYVIFDDTFHFMTKRYVFEEVSYIFKWLLPVVLLLGPGFYFLMTRKVRNGTYQS
ncbi:hypothetical protein [Marinobacter salexigens]|uniref:Transglutaminase-like domain-containing protein n=1 Tax=Marinobacter salexigens TaxID=1925763 RepID=A0ABS6ADG4_9GAMM|nr:hypothetical protein [Marinobacter salexigens]MBU2875242.1 hypothetical protein [Marinobacter salexigens]